MHGLLPLITTAQTSGHGIIALVQDAGLMVKCVLLVLIVFSVISWAIIFVKALQIMKARRESDLFLKLFWDSKTLDDVERGLDGFPSSPIAKIFAAGYGELKKVLAATGQAGDQSAGSSRTRLATDNVPRAMHRAKTVEITRLEKAVPFLATTGNTSPFIGLFGTVWGIMSSFQSIGVQGSASLAVVAPGISEALIATATGLFAAIPAVMAYNSFANRIRILEADMDSFSSEFQNMLERRLTTSASRETGRG